MGKDDIISLIIIKKRTVFGCTYKTTSHKITVSASRLYCDEACPQRKQTSITCIRCRLFGELTGFWAHKHCRFCNVESRVLKWNGFATTNYLNGDV